LADGGGQPDIDFRTMDYLRGELERYTDRDDQVLLRPSFSNAVERTIREVGGDDPKERRRVADAILEHFKGDPVVAGELKRSRPRDLAVDEAWGAVDKAEGKVDEARTAAKIALKAKDPVRFEAQMSKLAACKEEYKNAVVTLRAAELDEAKRYDAQVDAYSASLRDAQNGRDELDFRVLNGDEYFDAKLGALRGRGVDPDIAIEQKANDDAALFGPLYRAEAAEHKVDYAKNELFQARRAVLAELEQPNHNAETMRDLKGWLENCRANYGKAAVAECEAALQEAIGVAKRAHKSVEDELGVRECRVRLEEAEKCKNDVSHDLKRKDYYLDSVNDLLKGTTPNDLVT
jgi:hypothetical protein